MTTPYPTPTDTIAAIAAVDRDHDPALVARRYATMRRDPFAFMRGTCHLFNSSSLDAFASVPAPCAWLCGDLHAENFGTYKGDNRLTYFDVNDFSASSIGPVTLDVGRLITSILVGGPEWGLSSDDSAALAQRALVTYATELASGKPSWIERESARGMVKRLFAQVAGRSRAELLARYTTRKGKRRRLIVDDRHTMAATDAERMVVGHVIASLGAAARDDVYFRLVDVARDLDGIACTAGPEFIAIVEGRGSPDRNVLLGVMAAEAPPRLDPPGVTQPAWQSEAERVVQVQRHATAVPPAFLHSAEHWGASYIVRELQPIDDRVHPRDWEKQPRKLGDAVIIMAAVSAWMHLRGGAWRGSDSVDLLAAFGRDPEWRATLLTHARDAAARTLSQFREFSTAYDSGDLAPAL